jgi:K+-transporting ATPase ATPase B chain
MTNKIKRYKTKRFKMASQKKNSKLFESSLVAGALKQSFIKLKPSVMLRNPVMFTVYVGTIIMLAVCVWIGTGERTQGSLAYNLTIFAVLFITLLFANFAEAIAEARGKAQADSLRKTREDTPAKKNISNWRYVCK